jgi:hypothetical protein
MKNYILILFSYLFIQTNVNAQVCLGWSRTEVITMLTTGNSYNIIETDSKITAYVKDTTMSCTIVDFSFNEVASCERVRMYYKKSAYLELISYLASIAIKAEKDLYYIPNLYGDILVYSIQYYSNGFMVVVTYLD